MRTVLALTFVFAIAYSASIDMRKLPKVQMPKGKVPGGFLCSICESLVTEVEALAKQEEPDIENEVNAFCEALGPLSDMCKSIVDGYLDQILDNIGQELPPDQVCANIGLC